MFRSIHFWLLFALSTPVAAQCTNEFDSPSWSGTPNGSAGLCALSSDGNSVFFYSGASNLVPGVSNGNLIYVYDRPSGTLAVASLGQGGVVPGGVYQENAIAITPDGRYLAFATTVSDMVPGDANGAADVFVRDLVLGTTVRASLTSAGGELNGASHVPAISADGRFVAFRTTATNALPGGNLRGAFVEDLVTGALEMVSVSSSGAQANAPTDDVAISGNGRFVAFRSGATNLGASLSTTYNYFVRDRTLGTTTFVAGAIAAGTFVGDLFNGERMGFDFLGDRFVFSTAQPLVSDDTNGLSDVYLLDVPTGAIRCISRPAGGVPVDGGCPALTPDGNLVVYQSTSLLLVPTPTGPYVDVFACDLRTGVQSRVSVNQAGGVANQSSYAGAVSADGLTFAFVSYATDIVVGSPMDTTSDIYVHSCATSYAAFCAGTAANCPCSNGGAPGNGCANSIAPAGAQLAGSGTGSVSSDTLVLSGTGMPDSSALYFQGTDTLAGGAGVIFGDGLRCVGGTVIRLSTKTNTAGASQYPTAGDQPLGVRGMITAPGQRFYQVWYRNAASFCTSSTFNLTNGLSVVWGP